MWIRVSAHMVILGRLSNIKLQIGVRLVWLRISISLCAATTADRSVQLLLQLGNLICLSLLLLAHLLCVLLHLLEQLLAIIELLLEISFFLFAFFQFLPQLAIHRLQFLHLVLITVDGIAMFEHVLSQSLLLRLQLAIGSLLVLKFRLQIGQSIFKFLSLLIESIRDFLLEASKFLLRLLQLLLQVLVMIL